jgi:YidC/Oxa1 family membrane protein insertase
MRVRKPLALAIIMLIVVGYVLSFTSVFAGYNVSVEAEGTAYQGSSNAVYTVKIKNIGSENIDSAEVYIRAIDGKPVTSNSKYQVSRNPQPITFLGIGVDTKTNFPIGVDRSIEPGSKTVDIEIHIGDTIIKNTGTLDILKSETAISTTDSGINVFVNTKTAPNENTIMTVKIENPKSNSYDISRISVELVGIASDAEYTDVKAIEYITAKDFIESSFFSFTSNDSPSKLYLESSESIAPGKSNSKIIFKLATGQNTEMKTYYPILKVTYLAMDSNPVEHTVEIKDPESATILVKSASWFKKPFRWFLDMLKDTVGFGSYGIAIVLLGILLKVVLIPLTNVQFKSMKKNAEVQPLIKVINEKYPGKENAQKKQEETMKVYKEHNVNLFAGCLPMLVQLPIIIALYTAISNYAPLNFASFLWMPSLGIPDPAFVMPVLMAASTWFQQKVSQMPGQDSNIAFQIIFPLFLGYIALSFPSALTIYWVTFTLASIAHQMLFNKKSFNSYMLKTSKAAPATIDSKKS